MLASLDAQEIAEWKAFEAINGPLDRTWDQEILAQIHELLQAQFTGDPRKIHAVARPWREDNSEEVKAKKAEQQVREKEATVSALDRALEAQFG